MEKVSLTRSNLDQPRAAALLEGIVTNTSVRLFKLFLLIISSLSLSLQIGLLMINPFISKFTPTWYFLVQLGIPDYESKVRLVKFKIENPI